MLVKDICKEEIITSDINDSLKEVSKKMLLHDIGFIPITKNNNIIGVLTDRDIVIRALTEDKDDLKEIISTNINSVDINEDIDVALNIFRKFQIKRLLVTDNDKYIGVISLSDILKSNDNKEILETLKSIYSEHSEDKNVQVDTFEL